MRAGVLFYIVAAISLLDALTTLTNRMNFARHDAAHGYAALTMAVAFAAIGWALMPRARGAQ